MKETHGTHVEKRHFKEFFKPLNRIHHIKYHGSPMPWAHKTPMVNPSMTKTRLS